MSNAQWRAIILIGGLSCFVHALHAGNREDAISVLSFAISIVILQIILQGVFAIIDRVWPDDKKVEP